MLRCGVLRMLGMLCCACCAVQVTWMPMTCLTWRTSLSATQVGGRRALPQSHSHIMRLDACFKLRWYRLLKSPCSNRPWLRCCVAAAAAAAAERDYDRFFRRHFWQARSSDSEGEEAGEPQDGDQPQQQQQQEQPAGGGSGEPGSNRSTKSGKGAG